MTNIFSKPPHFLYEHFIKRQREGVSFVVFFFFLISFISARLWVYAAAAGLIVDSLSSNIRGVHVHHFAYGILLSSVVGFLALVLPRHLFHLWKIKLAAFYGIGLGLTFDEFGMWLRLQDDYYLRHNYDAIIIIAIIFINIIYFNNLWKRLGLVVYKDFRRIFNWKLL